MCLRTAGVWAGCHFLILPTVLCLEDLGHLWILAVARHPQNGSAIEGQRVTTAVVNRQWHKAPVVFGTDQLSKCLTQKPVIVFEKNKTKQITSALTQESPQQAKECCLQCEGQLCSCLWEWDRTLQRVKWGKRLHCSVLCQATQQSPQKRLGRKADIPRGLGMRSPLLWWRKWRSSAQAPDSPGNKGNRCLLSSFHRMGTLAKDLTHLPTWNPPVMINAESKITLEASLWARVTHCSNVCHHSTDYSSGLYKKEMELRTGIQHSACSLWAQCDQLTCCCDFLRGELNSKSVSLESRPFLSWSAVIRESEQKTSNWDVSCAHSWAKPRAEQSPVLDAWPQTPQELKQGG